jgi:effector-binding domain-containing protein
MEEQEQSNVDSKDVLKVLFTINEERVVLKRQLNTTTEEIKKLQRKLKRYTLLKKNFITYIGILYSGTLVLLLLAKFLFK